MNTLETYNHNFNDFENSVFPPFGPLESVIKKVLKNRGIKAFSVKIVNDGWIRNHYILKPDEEGEFVALEKLPDFNENNNDLGWLNKAKRTIDEMRESEPTKSLTEYFEIYRGLKLLAKKYGDTNKHINDSVVDDSVIVNKNYESIISEAKMRINK